MRLHRQTFSDQPSAHQQLILQVNIRAGQLPPAEANGVAYLKIPLNAL